MGQRLDERLIPHDDEVPRRLIPCGARLHGRPEELLYFLVAHGLVLEFPRVAPLHDFIHVHTSFDRSFHTVFFMLYIFIIT